MPLVPLAPGCLPFASEEHELFLHLRIGSFASCAGLSSEAVEFLISTGRPLRLAIRVEHCSVEVNPRGEIARWPLGGRRTEPSTSLPLVP
jgi:hypothetical protein